MKVLIVGAGSIGNHLAHAARTMDWDVVVCDADPKALARMSSETYPTRYGEWDDNIDLALSEAGGLPQSDCDIIMIGTPPDSHLALARQALVLNPRILHIEKPLGTPLDDFEKFGEESAKHPHTMVTVGYDHSIALSVQHALTLIAQGVLGDVSAIEAYTNEHWAGIFHAHPWLTGPHDSYLGYWRRGGGALCEHSHALHLGLVVAEVAGWGPLELRCAHSDIFSGQHREEYDRASHLILTPKDGTRSLRVVQDVITRPAIKGFRVIGEIGRVDVALSPALDTVTLYQTDLKPNVVRFEKTRPQDFHELMLHYNALLSDEIGYQKSPIHIDSGIQVMRFIQNAFQSES